MNDAIFNKGVDLEILNTTELRLLLHKYFYNNINDINELMSIINGAIDTLSIDYNDESKSIAIKIKKTSMKRNSNFTHNTDYYYPIFNEIFRQFFANNLRGIIEAAKTDHYNTDTLYNYISLIPGIYNITCMSDNIVILYL